MATLIDLAQRGFIDIYNREVTLWYKKLLDDRLRVRFCPTKIYCLKRYFYLLRRWQIQRMLRNGSRHLFSRKLRWFILEYTTVHQVLGICELPAKLHLKYRIAGIIMFFPGLIVI